MGWGKVIEPTSDAQLERVLEAYDRLFHRCRHHAPDLTRLLPSPHELRTGETPARFTDRMERLRAGVHLHEQEVGDVR